MSEWSQGGPKLGPIEMEIRKLIKRPQPKPPKVKKNATEAANGTVNGTVNGTAPNATEGAEPEGGAAKAEEEDLPSHDEL